MTAVVGEEVLGPLRVGPIAHGHCVARQEGRVIFVRHALPGELVRARVTDAGNARFWRADAVEVLEPSPDRVPARCPVSGPGGCGGCDFQHVSLAGQRRLKQAVVAEQLRRLAGLTWTGEVEEVRSPETADGLDWRTRMRYHVDGAGRAGLYVHRSHEVIPVPAAGCPIASPRTPSVTDRRWAPGAVLEAIGGAGGATLLVDGAVVSGPDPVTERAAGRTFAVSADGFWQGHPAAADTLVAAVLGGLDPQPGERAFDLYAGVGLFAAALADRGCLVWGVESNRSAVAAGRRNLAGVDPEPRWTAGRVERSLPGLPARTELVVLDPPRTGAGRPVVQQIARRRPRAVAYVACDPAALARDLRYADELGYRPTRIRAFDLFPMTHHVECVAVLQPR